MRRQVRGPGPGDRRRRPVAVVVLLAWTMAQGLVGCADQEDGVDGVDGVDRADAEQRLEQQREDVRAGAEELVVSLARVAGGEVGRSDGRFEGCHSAGPDLEHRDFSYGVSARIELGGGDPVLPALGEALAEQGYAVGDRTSEGDRTALSATRAGSDVRVRLTEYADHPDHTDHTGHIERYLLVGLRGPCVEVPPARREAWADRRESEPLVLDEAPG